MARRGRNITKGAEVGLYLVLVILVIVAIWYFLTSGQSNLAAWLDQKSSNFAGGISNGLLNVSNNGGLLSPVASAVNGPVESWLSGLTYGLTEWDNSLNSVGS